MTVAIVRCSFSCPFHLLTLPGALWDTTSAAMPSAVHAASEESDYPDALSVELEELALCPTDNVTLAFYLVVVPSCDAKAQSCTHSTALAVALYIHTAERCDG